MLLESVNVGALYPLQGQGKPRGTGIIKTPVAGEVRVGPDGVAGDVVADTRNHGGPDQAVYVYGSPDLAWWSAELGRTLEPGTFFGENCRVLDPGAVRAGDAVALVPAPEPSVKLLDVFRLWCAQHDEVDTLRAVLRAPLAERARREYEERLERAVSRAS